MDTNNQTTDEISKVGTFSVTTVKDYPVQFDQYLSEAPSGIKSSVKVPRTQLTSRSNLKSVNRSAVIGSYDINLPIKEAVLRIASVYKTAYEKAFNYDRTHYDSFFDAYPELALLSTTPYTPSSGGTPGTGELRPTTQEFKAQVKKWVKRFSHKYYYYEVACMNMIAAYANMLVLTRFDGSYPFKDIASHFRWSRLNSIAGKLPRWYWPKGLFDFVTKVLCYAVGRTTYGADIVLFPHIVTDVFGSRGAQAPDFLSSFGITTTDDPVDISGGDCNLTDPMGASMMHSYAVYKQYGCAVGGLCTPNGPFIENGETIQSIYDASASTNSDEVFFTNRHGVYPRFSLADPDNKIPFKASPNGSSQNWDNLLDSYYAAFTFWENVCNVHFAEFADPNSDMVDFFTKEIGLLEQGKTGLDMLNVIRSNSNIELSDLLKIKSYKSANTPTTASWIKLSMPVHVDSAAAGSNAYASRGDLWDDASILGNLERYPVDSMYPGDVVEASKLWPSNTPNTFDFAENAPHALTGSLTTHPYPAVPNAIAAFGEDTTFTGDVSQPNIGKYATWLDRCCSSSMAPEDTYIEGVGIGAQTLEDYVKAGGGIVFEENHTKVFVPDFPTFDCSDPYQCGVNLLIAEQHTDNEWERYFGSNSKFFGASNSYSEKHYPSILSGAAACNFHTADYRYDRAIGHALIFVGMGILHHPLMTYGLRNSGNPVRMIKIADYGSSNNPVRAYIANNCNLAQSSDYIKMLFDAVECSGWFEDGTTTPAVNRSASTDYQGFLTAIGTGSGTAFVVRSMFNPAYGNVALSLAINPLDEIADSMPPLHEASPFVGVVKNPNYYGTAAVNETGPNDPVGLPGTDDIWDINQTPANSTDVSSYSYRTSLRSALAGFIDHFKYRQARYDNHLLRPSSLDVGAIHFGGIRSWVCSIMSKSMAQFLGIEDLKAFWSADVLSSTASLQAHQTVKSTGAMPENPIVAEPRVPNSIVKDRRSFSHTVNTKADAPENPRNYTTKSSGRGKSRPNEPRGKSRRRRASRDMKTGSDTSDSITFNRDGLASDKMSGTIPNTQKERPRKDPRGPFDAAASIMQ